MLKLLVAVDRSLEASFALRTACLFGPQIGIQPIYVFDPPGRDISFGAGWARKSWERETNRQAGEEIGELVLAERNQCPNIEDSVVLTGEPVQELTGYFWKGGYDILVVGAPFRGWEPQALSRHFWPAAQKANRDLPLLVVHHLNPIKSMVVLTDGSKPAENALGLMVRMRPYLPDDITLVGLTRNGKPKAEKEELSLERGLAILEEKDIQAKGVRVSELGTSGLKDMLKSTDLVVKPFLLDEGHAEVHEVLENETQAVLFYLGRD